MVGWRSQLSKKVVGDELVIDGGGILEDLEKK